jgi:hypothetical protein
MQTREAPNKELKYLAFNEVFDALAEGDPAKALYVLERSTFQENEKQVLKALLETFKTIEVKENA